MEKTQDELDLYEIFFNDSESDFVYNMGIVSQPANQQSILKFSDGEKNTLKLNFKTDKVDKDKRIITGIALIPNQKIIRKNHLRDTFYNIFYSKETIEKYAHSFILQNNKDNVTIEHQYSTNGVKLIESWLSKSDKELDFDEAVVGTWFLSYYVESEELWEEIQNETFNGLSIEIQFTKIEKVEKENLKKINIKMKDNKEDVIVDEKQEDVIVDEKPTDVIDDEKPTEDIVDLEEMIKNQAQLIADLTLRVEKLEGTDIEDEQKDDVIDDEKQSTIEDDLKAENEGLKTQIEKMKEETLAEKPQLNYNENTNTKEMTRYDYWNKARKENK